MAYLHPTLLLMFNGGLTASYIVWTRVFESKTQYGPTSFLSLMGGMNVLMVNYFNANVPYSIVKRPKLRAGVFRIYWRIMLPLSKPVRPP